MSTKHEVKWKGRTFQISAPTRGQKKEFCEWLIKRKQDEYIHDFLNVPHVLKMMLEGVKDRIYWIPKGMSSAVQDAIRGVDGGLLYTRMLFKLKETELSNEDLTALIDEKEGEQTRYIEKLIEQGMEPPYPPVNDYSMAIMAINEETDPKANGPENGSAPTLTP